MMFVSQTLSAFGIMGLRVGLEIHSSPASINLNMVTQNLFWIEILHITYYLLQITITNNSNNK